MFYAPFDFYIVLSGALLLAPVTPAYAYVDQTQRDNGNIKILKNVKYRLKVVGFVAQTECLIDAVTVYPKSLNAIYSSVQDLKGEFEVSGIVSYLDNGDTLALGRTFLPLGCIFFLNEGYTEENLREELRRMGYSDESLVSYSFLLEKYDHDYMDEIRMSRIMMIVSGILTVAVITSAFFSNYIRRRKELSVYSLLGGTWNECILISISPYGLSIIMGTVLGWALWNFWTSGGSGGLRLPILFYIILFIIYSVTIGIMGLVYYFAYKKIDPIAQYASEGSIC